MLTFKSEFLIKLFFWSEQTEMIQKRQSEK